MKFQYKLKKKKGIPASGSKALMYSVTEYDQIFQKEYFDHLYQIRSLQFFPCLVNYGGNGFYLIP